MSSTAKAYIRSFSWCPPIAKMYLGYGVGNVVSLFLVKFSEKIQDTDDRLWIVVGDLPSAYFVVNSNDAPYEALERYCVLMEEWVAAVISFGDFSAVYPVQAERTFENAKLLRSRIDFIRSDIMPSVSTDTIPE